MPRVLLALGSNVGDRLSHLREAVTELQTRVSLLRASEVYETAPMYVTDQEPFYNAAVLAQTDLSPRDLLKTLKNTETELGRRAGRRYGPREIDIDLVGYGVLRYRFQQKDHPELEVPHPKVVERRFVLQPLADIAPDWNLPGLGRVTVLLTSTEDQADSVIKTGHGLLPVHGGR